MASPVDGRIFLFPSVGVVGVSGFSGVVVDGVVGGVVDDGGGVVVDGGGVVVDGGGVVVDGGVGGVLGGVVGGL